MQPLDQPPHPSIPTAPPPTSKNRTPLIIGAIVAALVVLGGSGIGAAWFFARDAKPAAQAGTAAPIAEPEIGLPDVESETLPDPAPTTAAPTPLATDFKLTPKIIDKECFGSAGCIVSFRIDLTYRGITSLSPDDTWLITYEAAGGQDGPLVGSLTLTGETFESSEETVQTASSKKKITLKVTDVSKDGI